MTDKTKAVADLVWISQRLSGIVALQDDLKDYDSLSNKLKELSQSVGKTKQELEDTLQERDKTKKEIDALLKQNAAIAADYKSRGDKIIQDARLEADDLVQTLKSDYTAQEKLAKENLTHLGISISDAKNLLNQTNAQVSDATIKRDMILKEIQDLKNRI